jgi:alpha-ketoglutaric semialdehyde dehydrogenase
MLSVKGLSKIGCSLANANDHFFYAYNPSTRSAFPTLFYQATKTEVDDAVSQAVAISDWFRDSSLLVRSQLLNKIADGIRLHEERLKKWYCLETALPMDRATSELNRAIFQFQSYAQALLLGIPLEVRIDEGDTEKQPIPLPDIRKMNVALGPVVVFGASNFPFAYSTIGGDVAGALAAGCPVIVKAHVLHPHTSEVCAQIITEALQQLDLDQGIFSHLFSHDFKVGEQLVVHPDIQAVGFTGSIKGGLSLIRLAATRPVPIPVYAEMGSSNPIIINETALMQSSEEIAVKIAQSVTVNAGQFCTSPGLLLFVKSDRTLQLVRQMRAIFEKQQPITMLGDTIFQQYVQRSTEQLSVSLIEFDGMRSNNAISPTFTMISGQRFIQDPTVQEEIFGSFITGIACENEHELLDAMKLLQGQLTGSLFCGDETGDLFEKQLKLLKSKVGRIIVNGVPTGVAVTAAMHHGGPFPSSSHSYFSAVGLDSIKRFMRPIAFQNFPDNGLPDALKRANPFNILRFVNGNYQ